MVPGSLRSRNYRGTGACPNALLSWERSGCAKCGQIETLPRSAWQMETDVVCNDSRQLFDLLACSEGVCWERAHLEAVLAASPRCPASQIDRLFNPPRGRSKGHVIDIARLSASFDQSIYAIPVADPASVTLCRSPIPQDRLRAGNVREKRHELAAAGPAPISGEALVRPSSLGLSFDGASVPRAFPAKTELPSMLYLIVFTQFRAQNRFTLLLELL